MTDLDNWLTWVHRNHPALKHSDQQLIDLYNKHYSCNCDSCTYNKSKGNIPHRIRPGCTSPITPPNLMELI